LTFNFTLVNPEPVILSIVPNSLYEETCDGDSNGEFSIYVSGGTMPYSVSLDNYDGPYTTGAANQTQFDFTNLSGGDHLVYIRDAEGCESQWNITFPEPISFNPEIEVIVECINNSLSNTITVLVDDSEVDLNDLDYSLNGGPFQISNVFTDVEPGLDHYIEVRHTNGCIESTEFFDIDDYQGLTLNLIEGDEAGQIIAEVLGGSGVYEFSLNGVSYGSTNVFMVTEEGTYTVVVVDDLGCEVQASINIDILGPCIPNWFTPNGDGEADTWGPGCSEDFPNLTFDIFDRYGRKIATLNVNEKWDGRYNGAELPTGDYWYVVLPNSPLVKESYVGHFTLYR
ncbi:MAG: T9SS type B sorting domain-containing protein, partial [Psychroserpens sp.]|nr:T9SS type B sorting domain-containing protein [Psychroserpens sp.]